MTGNTSQTPSVGDNPNMSRETEATTKTQTTTTTVTTSTTNSPAKSTDASYGPQVYPVVSVSTAQINGRRPSTSNDEYASSRDNSSGTDRVLIDRPRLNSSSEVWRPPTDTDAYYYTDETETADKDAQQSSLLTNNNETDDDGGRDVDHTRDMVEHESVSLQQLTASNETFVNISGAEEIDDSTVAVINDSSVESRSQPRVWVSRSSTTSTASPKSTAWLLAELPSGPDWSGEADSPGEYAAAHREPPSSRAMLSPATFLTRFHRLRPARHRDSGYRQMLASPFVAGGRAMSERERKRALLRAYLLSGITAKEPSHRRAMSAAVFYRSKLTKPSPMQHLSLIHI